MFAAEGYAKVTGEVGVCIATSGPGATNLVTGLADALLDSVPMVAITGQVTAPSSCGLIASLTLILPRSRWSSPIRMQPSSVAICGATQNKRVGSLSKSVVHQPPVPMCSLSTSLHLHVLRVTDGPPHRPHRVCARRFRAA